MLVADDNGWFASYTGLVLSLTDDILKNVSASNVQRYLTKIVNKRRKWVPLYHKGKMIYIYIYIYINVYIVSIYIKPKMIN